MPFFKRSSRLAGLALFLAITCLGTLLPVLGYGETLRFVFTADCRGKDRLINTEALQEINSRILALSPPGPPSCFSAATWPFGASMPTAAITSRPSSKR